MKQNQPTKERNNLAGYQEETLTIEDIKEKIECFQPESFRETVAYERYLQALSFNPEREEEIDRVFYKLVVRRKDLESFYRQLYALAPKLLQQTSTTIYV